MNILNIIRNNDTIPKPCHDHGLNQEEIAAHVNFGEVHTFHNVDPSSLVYVWRTPNVRQLAHYPSVSSRVTEVEGIYVWLEDCYDATKISTYEKMPIFMTELLATAVLINGVFYDTNSNEVGFCNYYQEYFLVENLVWYEPNEAYYHNDVPAHYYNDGDDANTQEIQRYHCGLSPVDKRQEPTECSTDVTGLGQFGIGFEVEKSSVNGSRCEGSTVDKQPLFNHWETDSSCGVEGITHIYNLDNYELFRKDALESEYLEEPTSQECGGHINISFQSKNITDFQLEMENISPFAGALYALFKVRLSNSYSRHNKKLLKSEEHESRYGAIVPKSGPQRYEFRLPSRVQSTVQILRRFKLFQVLCAHMYHKEMNSYTYRQKMHDINSKLDLMYGERTLYKTLRRDSLFKKDFFKSSTYYRTRFVLHELTQYMEESYSNDLTKLLSVITNAYQFQGWLDDNYNVDVRPVSEYLQYRGVVPLTREQKEFRCDIPVDDQQNSMQNSYEYIQIPQDFVEQLLQGA